MTSSELGRSVTQAQPPDDGWRVGRVQSVDPLVVTLQGGEIRLAGQLPVSVSVGDPVALARQDQSWLVVGALLPPAAPADRNITNGATTGLAVAGFSSATFTAVSGAAVAFTRYRPNSRLAFDLTVGLVPAGGSAVAAFALDVTDDDGNVWSPTLIGGAALSTDGAYEHLSIRRVLTPSGIGTGPMTAQMLWRRVSGTGTLGMGSGFQQFSLTIEEV